MIHRTHRFHGIKSLGFVYRRGQIVQGQGLSLKYVLNQRNQTYRVAVVVSRKVSKSAVVRNRIRRRIYEAVRMVENEITSAYDLVFLVREAELAKVRSKNLVTLIHTQLAKAGVIAGVPLSATDQNHAIVLPKEKNT